jgi:histone H3
MARTKQVMGRYKHAKALAKPAGKPTLVPRRYRPGTVALREIRRYQGGTKDATKLLLRKLPFSRLVREITQDLGHGTIRFKKDAMSALQHISEAYLTYMTNDAQDYAIHAGRAQINKSDLRLAAWKRNETQEERNLANTNMIWKPLRAAPTRRKKKNPNTKVVSRRAYAEANKGVLRAGRALGTSGKSARKPGRDLSTLGNNIRGKLNKRSSPKVRKDLAVSAPRSHPAVIPNDAEDDTSEEEAPSPEENTVSSTDEIPV